MSSLYENFPTIDYNGYIVRNLTVRIGIADYLKSVVSVYENYIVENNETPEIVAYKFYGDAELHWVVLLMNDIIDPLFDWPLDQQALSKYVTANYGAGNENKPHHYEFDGRVVQYVPPDPLNPYAGLPIGYTLVTNAEHEEKINEEKRKIKVMSKHYVEDIMSEVRRLVTSNAQ